MGTSRLFLFYPNANDKRFTSNWDFFPVLVVFVKDWKVIRSYGGKTNGFKAGIQTPLTGPTTLPRVFAKLLSIN